MRTNGPDPHRVLGVTRDATEEEIKRAYRALAKRHHPDADRGSVPRFLELQAAYETLMANGGGDAGVSGRAAREATPGRTARAGRRPAGPDGHDGGGSAGWRARPESGSARGRPGPGGEESRPGPESERSHPGPNDAPRARRSSGRRRATLGSTSYDGADAAFEPDWRGASWYGQSLGTYWTINPREYADPRKHGPEYQARARRGAEAAGEGRGRQAEAPNGPADAGASDADAGADVGGGLRGDANADAANADAATAGVAGAASRSEPAPEPPRASRAPSDRKPPRSAGRPSAAPSPSRKSRTRGHGPGVPTRAVLAFAAWLAPGIAVAAAVGLPGGFAASLPVQAAGVVVLAFVPRAAWALVGGGIALALAAVPIVAGVAALGGPFVPGEPAPEAAVVLACLAWVVGLGLVGAGRVAPYPWPGDTQVP